MYKCLKVLQIFALKGHKQTLILHFITSESTLSYQFENISMSLSKKKVSSINSNTNICNNFKSNLLVQQILT